MLTLTKEDREMLIASGHSRSDIIEIVSSLKKTEYFLKSPSGDETSITPEEAASILGREEWARGVARSTFYSESTRYGLADERVVIRSKNYLR